MFHVSPALKSPEILTTDVRTTGHSAANAVARIGSLFAPFLIEGHSSLVKKGLVMLAIHACTVLCVSQLQETKGAHMGRIAHVSSEDEDDDNDNHRDETRILNEDYADPSCRAVSPIMTTTTTTAERGNHTEDSERLIT